MADSLHGNATEVWVAGRVLRRIFGIADKTLHDRKVRTRQGDGRIEFELADFWAKCANLVVQKLRETGLGIALEDSEALKAEKLAEEVRKLKIANDEAEGILVRADEVEAEMGRMVRAIADELDGIPVAVKVACPDIPQAALATISDKIAAARNKAASVGLDD